MAVTSWPRPLGQTHLALLFRLRNRNYYLLSAHHLKKSIPIFANHIIARFCINNHSSSVCFFFRFSKWKMDSPTFSCPCFGTQSNISMLSEVVRSLGEQKAECHPYAIYFRHREVLHTRRFQLDPKLVLQVSQVVRSISCSTCGTTQATFCRTTLRTAHVASDLCQNLLGIYLLYSFQKYSFEFFTWDVSFLVARRLSKVKQQRSISSYFAVTMCV